MKWPLYEAGDVLKLEAGKHSYILVSSMKNSFHHGRKIKRWKECVIRDTLKNSQIDELLIMTINAENKVMEKVILKAMFKMQYNHNIINYRKAKTF